MTSSDLNVSSVRKKRTRTVIQNVNGDFEEEAILTRRQRMSNDEEDSLVIFKVIFNHFFFNLISKF